MDGTHIDKGEKAVDLIITNEIYQFPLCVMYYQTEVSSGSSKNHASHKESNNDGSFIGHCRRSVHQYR